MICFLNGTTPIRWYVCLMNAHLAKLSSFYFRELLYAFHFFLYVAVCCCCGLSVLLFRCSPFIVDIFSIGFRLLPEFLCCFIELWLLNSGILILPLFEICWTMKGSILCSIYYEGLLPSFWSIPCACFEQNLSCTQMIFSRQYWLKTASFVEIGCSEVDIHWFRLESILNSLYFTPFGLDATQMCLRSTLFPHFWNDPAYSELKKVVGVLTISRPLSIENCKSVSFYNIDTDIALSRCLVFFSRRSERIWLGWYIILQGENSLKVTWTFKSRSLVKEILRIPMIQISVY